MRFASLLAALFLFTACPSDDDPASPPVNRSDAGQPDVLVPDGEPVRSCTDGEKNGDEGGVDCGGSCDADCATWSECSVDEDCAKGEHCAGLDDRDDDHDLTTCRPRVESCEGNPCGDEAYCRQYLSGSDGLDTEIYFCEQRHAIGQACNVGSDKDVNVCATGLRCQNEVCIPALKIGQDCNPEFEFAACDEGLTCYPNPFVEQCMVGGGATQSCGEDYHCGPGLHCDELAGVCQPRATKGGSCYAAEQGCGVGLECQFDAGLRCEIGFDCGSQMECCASGDGEAECRVYDGHSPHCQPPAGRCETHTYLDNDL